MLKFLENKRELFHDLRFGKAFLNMAPKDKIDEFDFIKIKKFCASMDTIKKMKRHLHR